MTEAQKHDVGMCGLEHHVDRICIHCTSQLELFMNSSFSTSVDDHTPGVDEEIALLEEPTEGEFVLDEDGFPVDAPLTGGFSTFEVEAEPITVALTDEERTLALSRLDSMGMHSIADEV